MYLHKRKKEKTLQFFDGETIKDKYVLLGNANNYIFNKKGLSCKDSLDFLFNEAQSYNYFFRVDYDLNMIFSNEDLNNKEIFIDKESNEKKELSLVAALFSGYKINYCGYELEYFRHKILSIRIDNKTKKFFDVSNFFHVSFLRTLEILEIELTEYEKDLIETFKKKRSGFVLSEKNKIIEYNQMECILGLKIVNKLYTLLPEYLKTYNLYGSSSLSHLFLTKKEIHKKNFLYAENLNTKMFECAYFGGRMEALKIGKFENLWKYDINSAYPNIIKDLRIVKNIDVIEKKPKKIIDTNLYYIEMNIKDLRLPGLLPYRLKSGYLVFPANVKGWYYGIEVKNVIEYSKKFDIYYDIQSEIKIELGNKLFSDNEIEELYLIRRELKIKKDLRNHIFKILLNSIYGKLAQRSGSRKFLNFYYAGLITSFTRAKLLEVIKDNPKEAVFFATDGILTKKKIKGLPITDNLGDFEEIKIKESYNIMSGVYKCISTDNKNIYAERGFKANLDDIIIDIRKNYNSEIKQNIFIGNKYFEKNYKAYKGKRCKFIEVKKIIDIRNQIKRLFNSFEIDKQNDSRLLFLEELEKINRIPLNVEELKELILINDFEDFEL